MWAIEDSKDVRIKQSSTGSHFFEDETHEPDDPRALMSIPVHTLEDMLGIVRKLHQLRLSIDTNPRHLERILGNSESRVQQMFAKASNLERLTLATRLPKSAVANQNRVESAW